MTTDGSTENASIEDIDWDQVTIVDRDGTPESGDEPSWTGDPLLNMLIHLAEKGAGSYITLFSSGLVFSGIIMSRRAFFEENVSFLGPKNGVRLLFEQMIAALDENGEVGDEMPDYAYVHLRDARTFVPGQDGLPANGSVMRIAKSDVIGWSMGKYQAQQR